MCLTGSEGGDVLFVCCLLHERFGGCLKSHATIPLINKSSHCVTCVGHRSLCAAVNHWLCRLPYMHMYMYIYIYIYVYRYIYRDIDRERERERSHIDSVRSRAIRCGARIVNYVVSRATSGQDRTISAGNYTGVCEQNIPFTRALARQPSGINCSLAPDVVLFKLMFPRALFSGGVFFSDTCMIG